MQMPNLSYALAHNHPARGGSVGSQLKAWPIVEGVGQPLDVESLDRSFQRRVQLSLA
jgi:hypothetical protein